MIFVDGQIFSTTPLSEDLLSRLFESPRIIKQESWEAYPLFNPPEEFDSSSISAGFFYNNAIENAASALEMSVLAAKNSTNLFLESLSLEGT